MWGDGAAAAVPAAAALLRQPPAPAAAARRRRPQPHRRDRPRRAGATPAASADRPSTPGGSSTRSRRPPTCPPSERAEQLRAALDLWRGPAYAEYADESWAATEVARLTELRAVARDRLMDARLALGESAAARARARGAGRRGPAARGTMATAGPRALPRALGRATRWPRCGEPGRPWPTNWASNRDRRCGRWNATCWPNRPALDGPARMLAGVGRRRAAGPDRTGAATTGRPARRPTWWTATARSRALSRAVDDLRDGQRRHGADRGLRRDRQDRACSRRPAGWRPRPALRVLSARGSEMERAFGFGTVRQLFEPPLRRSGAVADALLGGAAAGARGVFEQSATDRADGSFAVLHGLYWLTVNLAVGRPAAARRRRRAVVRRRVPAVPRLPGQADRGPAGTASR